MAEGTQQAVMGRHGSGANVPAPTEPFSPIVDVASDRCPNCGADLAVDQRYCVECGARRGKPRYTLAAPEPVVPAAPVPTRSGAWFSPGAALLTGLAILLLALGVGVLIGHSGTNALGRQPVNVTVGAGSAAPSGSSASTGGTAARRSSTAHKARSGAHAKSASHAAAKPLPAAARKVAAPKPLKKAAAIASKHVTSTTGQSSIGSTCSGGAGCHNGKQTGVFFGGGG